ncbi:MAG: energy-coupling factor transporter transmembrane protein EcfT, partial [Chloroflexota bacterium]|nr:energy-coupling factor transporter transmembrane protein EcfT [Chloroflexota bacterium]
MIGSSPRLLSYEAGDSPLHRLDPRTKLFAMVAIVAGVLIATTPLTIGLAYLLGVLGGLLARHLLPILWRALRPLLVLIVLFGLIIVVVTPGHALIHLWILVPTRDGVQLAIRLGFQSLLIVYSTSLLTLTTPPLAIAGAMEWALGFLSRFKVPVRDIIAMVAIGLTFVPLLIEETQKVIAAQRARGADLGINALLNEDSMGALLIPLLLANLRRGGELAESMEARLYNTGPRTALMERHFGQE